ncbi:MAG: hypothetical protein WC450_04105 [Candidatus Omnitrophota bacterium]
MVWRFRVAGWDYEERRRDFKDAVPLMELRTLLPEGAVVEWPRNGGEISFVAARYILYPFRVLPEGNYVIDFKGDYVFPPGSDVIRLPDHARACAKPGFHFIRARGPERALSVSQTAALSMVFILFQAALGAAFLKIFGFPPCKRMPLFYMGLSYLTGYLFLTLSLWLSCLGGQGTAPFNLLLISGAVLVWTVFILKQEIILEIVRMLVSCWRSGSSRPDFRSLLPGALLGFIAVSVILSAISIPVTDWDGMSHWILKSKIVAFENKLDFSYTHNNYYPLLWPLNIAAQFVITGGLHDAFAKWTSAAFFLVFTVGLAQAVKSLSASNGTARLLTVLFVALSFRIPVGGERWFYNYIQSNAENIFLAFLTGLLCMTIRWLLSRETRYLVLAVVLGTGLVLTKLEGAVAVAATVVPLWGLSKLLKASRKEVCLLMLLTVSMALPLLWITWINGHGYGEVLLHVRSGLALGKTLLLVERIGGYATQNLFVILILTMFGVALAASGKQPWTATDTFLLIHAAGLLLFSVFAIACWPEAKLRSASLEVFQRLFLHAAPAVLLFSVSRLYPRPGCCGKA